MNLTFSWIKKWRQITGLTVIGAFVALTGESALAQSKIIPDETLGEESSQVRTDLEVQGNSAEIIEGGAQRGANLFHSFEEFNIENGRGAYFTNPTGVENIFSRVTGTNPSEISGTLGVLGNADLFLLNPQGIIFGENARLDIGGSFLGSTASSVLFEDGEFSANIENPPLLTVNVPIGLGFQDEPGDIINRSTVRDSLGEVVGLEVNPGNNITLLGGNIDFDAGNITAKGGNIKLSGLLQAGTIDINENGSLSFPEDIGRGNITLSNAADVDARGNGGGIDIDAANLSLLGNQSSIRAGIVNNSSINARSGNITIDVAENIVLNGSSISNQVDPGGVGNSGNVTINASSLSLTNGAGISSSTLGRGNAGNITINATGNLIFDGENEEGLPSGVGSLVGIDAIGNAGGVTISANNFTLTNGGQVSTTTLGQGNAGLVNIVITEDIILDGATSKGFRIRSSINSGVNTGAVGNAGGVSISTTNLTLTDGGEVSATTLGEGNGGDVTINASESIFISGVTEFTRSGISANALNFDGNGGNINVLTDQIIIEDGGSVEASNFDSSNVFSPATGRSGNISIEASSIALANAARIDAATQSETGIGGVVDLQVAENITLRDRSFISARAFSNANGGNLNIDTRFIIASPLENNDIIASASEGNGGNITIDADSLFGIEERPLDNLTNDINASSRFGLSGTVEINTLDINRDRDLVQLPERPTEREVIQACTPSNDKKQSEFVIKGSGGLAPSPEDPLDADVLEVDWISRQPRQNSSEITSVSPQSSPIIEAQGWTVNNNNEIVLVANNTHKQDWQNSPQCQSNSSLSNSSDRILIASTKPTTAVIPEQIRVDRFELEGNQAFDSDELARVLASFTNRHLTFSQLLQARSAITKYYTERGYITSGAYIPLQKLQDKVVKIQIVEGYLEDIEVTGNKRLNSDYLSRRFKTVSNSLQQEELLSTLQLLQQDPLIASISAELEAGTRPGASVLAVEVTEADSFTTPISLDNRRTPSVGSFRRQLAVNEGNLLGFGDSLFLAYGNTVGSDAFDGSYAVPFNASNGTLTLSGGVSQSEVIEEPFSQLNILGDSHYYELSLRQPLIQSPTQEFALGITASRRNSDISSLLEEFDISPSELSPGANENGETRVSALRFFQEWTSRNTREVIAARSQFNLGLGAFDATVNEDAPDSRFLSWQGQAQWTRQLAPDTSFLVRSGVQLATTSLLSSERFGLGGIGTLRGYRQDLLLTDNSAFASAEVRLPIFRLDRINSLVQLVPFLDVGTAWNNSDEREIESNTLASIGLGLRLLLSNSFVARFDWGIPLVSVDLEEKTWQENGLHFSVEYSPF